LITWFKVSLIAAMRSLSYQNRKMAASESSDLFRQKEK